MTISDLKIGERARVSEINLKGKIKTRLLGLGLVEGVKVTLIKIAPLGDPLEINFRNVYLGLRYSQAQNISVTPIKE